MIRVGDAGSTFDGDAESVLVRAREALNEREGGFAAQRQLMSGGVCEASAFLGVWVPHHGHCVPAWATTTTALPKDASRREYIHVDDYLGGVALMEEAARRVSDRANTAFRRRLQAVPDDIRRRLFDTSA